MLFCGGTSCSVMCGGGQERSDNILDHFLTQYKRKNLVFGTEDLSGRTLTTAGSQVFDNDESSLSSVSEGLPNQWKEEQNHPQLEAESTANNKENDDDLSESSVECNIRTKENDDDLSESSSVDCNIGMKEASLNDVSRPSSPQSKGSSLSMLDVIETTILDCSSCGSDAIIDHMDFGDKFIEREEMDLCEKVDPPGYVFEGASVMSEASDIIGDDTNLKAPTRKVHHERNGNEASTFIFPLKQPYQNQAIIDNESTPAQNALIFKPGSLNHVLDQVMKRNQETYLDFVRNSRCHEDIETSSACSVKESKEEDPKERVEWDLFASSNGSLLSDCEASSDSSEKGKFNFTKDGVTSRLSFFGVRRKRNQNKQNMCCEGSNEAELTTATLERFNKVGSLVVRRSDISLANLSRCDFRTSKEIYEWKRGDLGISCRNFKQVPVKQFSNVQFSGSESNRSQRASTELKYHETNNEFYSNRMRSSRSESSISSLFTETDVPVILDPLARPSKRMKKACNRVLSDGDVWVEKVLKNKKTGKKRSFFYSVKTGKRRVDEPPTGSFKVIYSANCSTDC